MSTSEDNFFKSNRVTAEKVSFKNQYQFNVVGNLFIPKGSGNATHSPAIIVGHVDLYDRVGLIPFTKLTQFFQIHLK